MVFVPRNLEKPFNICKPQPPHLPEALIICPSSPPNWWEDQSERSKLKKKKNKEKGYSICRLCGQLSKASCSAPYRFLVKNLLHFTWKREIPATWYLEGWYLEGRQVAPGHGPVRDIWRSGLLPLPEYLSGLPSRVALNSKCHNLYYASLKTSLYYLKCQVWLLFPSSCFLLKNTIYRWTVRSPVWHSSLNTDFRVCLPLSWNI